jgi:hypothetical protein
MSFAAKHEAMSEDRLWCLFVCDDAKSRKYISYLNEYDAGGVCAHSASGACVVYNNHWIASYNHCHHHQHAISAGRSAEDHLAGIFHAKRPVGSVGAAG